MNIEEIVVNKIKEKLNINSNLLPNDDLNSFGLDSLGSIDLILELEDEFDITFESEDLFIDNISTPEKIIKLIRGKLD
ncbi:acyl carrier protein [Paenibacillus chitinolyticus]|uniref:acyl carrier protein n=1 Tax=Paenibacillus chitinolyticus TaxID=79263 RepID=UPI0036DE64AA